MSYFFQRCNNSSVVPPPVRHLQAGKPGCFIFCSRCWRTPPWPTVCPGCRRRPTAPACSGSPLGTRTRWRRSGASGRAIRGPWRIRRCRERWETTRAPGRSSRWRGSSPTSSARTPCSHYSSVAMAEIRTIFLPTTFLLVLVSPPPPPCETLRSIVFLYIYIHFFFLWSLLGLLSLF